MENDIVLDIDLIMPQIKAANKYEILEELAKLLIFKGYVKCSFLDAVIEREKKFPTGLPTLGAGVAIPHADSNHVNMPGVAIATLEKPVKFNVMGNPEEEVDVNIVFMLAINDPKMQLQLLQEITKILQNQDVLLKLTQAKTKESILKIIMDIEKYKNV